MHDADVSASNRGQPKEHVQPAAQQRSEGQRAQETALISASTLASTISPRPRIISSGRRLGQTVPDAGGDGAAGLAGGG